MRRLGIAALIGYIAVIWLANYAVTNWGIVSVGFGLVAPAGVYFAGVAFTLRDLVQDGLGRRAVTFAIVAGAAVSYWLGSGGTIPGGHASVAAASGIAFLFSEAADFAVYTPLRDRNWLGAVTASNIVGACLDSAIFLWLAFGGLAFWKGQVVGKLWMTAVAVAFLWVAKHYFGREPQPV